MIKFIPQLFKPYDKIIVKDPVDNFYYLDWFSKYSTDENNNLYIETILGRYITEEPIHYSYELWTNKYSVLNEKCKDFKEAIEEHVDNEKQIEKTTTDINTNNIEKLLIDILNELKELNKHKLFDYPYFPPSTTPQPLNPYYKSEKYDPERWKIYCDVDKSTTDTSDEEKVTAKNNTYDWEKEVYIY